jgi:hypothetical protein
MVDPVSLSVRFFVPHNRRILHREAVERTAVERSMLTGKDRVTYYSVRGTLNKLGGLYGNDR